jgi:hypothetical protein
MADEGLLIPIQFTLEEARAALNELEARARKAGQSAGEGASKGFEGGLAGLKKSMGPAREQMMFFTSALGELGPAGKTAQVALTGIAGAVLGGGGLLAGMELARLAFGAIGASMEEADAKAKATTQALKSLTDASRAAYVAEAARLAQAQGVQTFDVAQRLLAVTREEEAAKRDLAAATWSWQASAARGRIDEARAGREAILATETETKKLRDKTAVIEAGKAANAAAWALQEEEARRIVAAEEKAKADAKAAKAKKDADARKADADVVARVNAELKAEEDAANERAATALAEDQAERNRNQRAIDHASFLMELADEAHQRQMDYFEKEAQAFEQSMTMDAVRSFSSQFVAAFRPVLLTSAAYDRAMKAAGGTAQNTADLSIAAFAAMTQGILASMAEQAAVESLLEVARAFAAYARYDYKAGSEHMVSAGAFAAAAAAAGVSAYVIGQTRGMTAAEKASVADAQASSAGGGSTGGAREFGGSGSTGSGGTTTVKETVYVIGDPFETPAETARRAARVMQLAGRLDMVRRAG